MIERVSAVLAMVVSRPAAGRVDVADVPRPVPGPAEFLVRVAVCGVCRTDLHLVDGDVQPARFPITPGHEVVGHVVELGPGVTGIAPGARVGIAWLGGACGACGYCTSGRENLCGEARFTGCHRDGGYAD